MKTRQMDTGVMALTGTVKVEYDDGSGLKEGAFVAHVILLKDGN